MVSNKEKIKLENSIWIYTITLINWHLPSFVYVWPLRFLAISLYTYRNMAGTTDWAIYLKKKYYWTWVSHHRKSSTNNLPPVICYTKETDVFLFFFLMCFMEESLIRAKTGNYFFILLFKYRSLLFCVFTYQLTTSFSWAPFSIYWQSDTYGIIKASLQVFYKTGWFEEKLSCFALKIDSKLSSFFLFVINCTQQVHESPKENYKIHSEAKTVVIYVILSEIFMSCSVISWAKYVFLEF